MRRFTTGWLRASSAIWRDSGKSRIVLLACKSVRRSATSPGGKHVEALLVNADHPGSACHFFTLDGADKCSAPNSAAGFRSMGTSSPEAHLQMLSEKLNLTEDQKAKLKPIFQDQAQQLKAVSDDPSLQASLTNAVGFRVALGSPRRTLDANRRNSS